MTARIAEASSRPVAIDLFCGAGGMSLGFEQAGFDVRLGVEYDGHHAATHARNFPDAVTLCKSVVDLDAAAISAALGGRSDIDLIFGGPPCQGFSSMGLRDALDPRNSLVDRFARIVAEVRPKAFVMENVPGMLAGSTRPVLDRVISFWKNAGYRIVHPIYTLNASAFGVPQKRRRLFVIGVRDDIARLPAYPRTACRGQPPRPTAWKPSRTCLGLRKMRPYSGSIPPSTIGSPRAPTPVSPEGSRPILPIFPTLAIGRCIAAPAACAYGTRPKRPPSTPRPSPVRPSRGTNCRASTRRASARRYGPVRIRRMARTPPRARSIPIDRAASRLVRRRDCTASRTGFPSIRPNGTPIGRSGTPSVRRSHGPSAERF